MTVPTARRGSEDGFTLVELLVVAVIVGVLVAIAVPVLTSQKERANDTAAQSDARSLGVMVAAAWGEGGTPVVSIDASRRYTIDGEPTFEASPGVMFVSHAGTSQDDWCLELAHPDGDAAASPGVTYGAQDGLAVRSSC